MYFITNISKEVNHKRFDNVLARKYSDELTKTGSALVEVLFFYLNIFLQVEQKTVPSASLKAILKTRHVGTTAERQFSSRTNASES